MLSSFLLAAVDIGNEVLNPHHVYMVEPTSTEATVVTHSMIACTKIKEVTALASGGTQHTEW